MIWIIALVVIFLLGLILYWQLIITEGAYLGAPLVAFLYDRTAERYNKIKEYDEGFETATLGTPLANRLCHQPGAMVLDVATGTGRIPRALFRHPTYRGHVIGLDRASKMLAIARRETKPQNRITLIQADAMALPFASNSLPLVTCLEALEFLPNPQNGLTELVRVLQPASPTHSSRGWLLVTNRVGWEARLMPGKTWRREELPRMLTNFPLRFININIWQTIYDLVWAQKYEL